MISPVIDRLLSKAPGEIGAYYNAYKNYRWGDPYLRQISVLADRSRLAIDVGAHVGDYTFFMRRHAAGCVAFECNPDLVAGLRRRFAQTVDIRPDAVSDRQGVTSLRIPRSGTGRGLGRATIETNNQLDDFVSADIIEVKTVRLDDVIGRPVGLIKVDVEGHELAVLRGTKQILERDRPNLLLELEERHAPGCVAAAFTFLGELGYRGYVLRDGVLAPVLPRDMSGCGNWNYVFSVNLISKESSV
jgi:FkbM family methyltransferase